MGYTLPPPSSSSSSSAQDAALSHAQSLIARKSTIEAALASQLQILTSQNASMSTPLVDNSGFPRADMDVFAVRTARVRILELRNDLNKVLEEVKVALEAVHAANAAAAAARDRDNINEDDRSNEMHQDESELVPFARIDGVAPGSPAASAGLQREDLILSFGSLTLSGLSSSLPSSSPSRLAPLSALASSHEDRPLELKILRAFHSHSHSEALTLTLVLTPRKWGGRGLIGCHIVPYTAPTPTPAPAATPASS